MPVCELTRASKVGSRPHHLQPGQGAPPDSDKAKWPSGPLSQAREGPSQGDIFLSDLRTFIAFGRFLWPPPNLVLN